MSAKPRTSPDLPWRTRLFISAMSFAVDASCRRNMTVNRFLFNLLDTKCSPSSKPINGVKTSDITVDESRDLWFRLFTPTDLTLTASLPVIVYFHGGGFVFMAANSKGFDDYCRKLARELPAVVISVNYRLAPEHRYPCQYEDGIDVLKFIDSTNIEGFPDFADLKRCFLAGDSAGGNLAHNVAVLANEHSFNKVKLSGIIAIQPFFGGEERTESETRLVGAPLVSMERADWMWKAFLPEGSNRDHAVVNVFGSNGVDISGVKFPATLVIVGKFDPLQDWQKRYYEGLKKCGKEAYLIEYPNACHGFYFFPELKEFSLFIKEVKEFLQKQSSK
ncbi:Alpha/beta hydrolase-3 [Melia azedarach]|uniref:Alpha/beta hydrolase-3 n=1 Tax=Melia azedarach TaxID=155640 RepID=A0ACC1XQV9_MELAZ|nr:Alpha/beta hydrolase-3 [Melia azedarach]